jgi:hypothetical protein
MGQMKYLVILSLLASCAGGNPVEHYLREHPRTLLAVAEALRRGEIVVDMSPGEAMLILGKPMGAMARNDRGRIQILVGDIENENLWKNLRQKYLILSFKKSVVFEDEKGLQKKYAGPLSLEFLQLPLGDDCLAWRLKKVRPIWR